MPVLRLFPENPTIPDCIRYIDLQPESKEAVFLIHGLGATGSSWQLQFPELKKAGLRIIAPDVPGFGGSIYKQARWSVQKATRILAGLIDQLEAAPLAVVGISMGGVLALQMALDRPDLIEKLVLVNTFARLRPDSLHGWGYFLQRAALIATRGLRAQAPYVAKRIFPEPDQEALRQLLIEQIFQSDPKVYRTAMQSLGLFNVYRRLTEIHHPVLVITGEKDTTVPLRTQRELADHIPGAQQTVIAHAGHAVIVDQADAFNRELLRFLKGQAISTAQASRLEN